MCHRKLHFTYFLTHLLASRISVLRGQLKNVTPDNVAPDGRGGLMSYNFFCSCVIAFASSIATLETISELCFTF